MLAYHIKTAPGNGTFLKTVTCPLKPSLAFYTTGRAAYKTMHHEFGISSHTVTDCENVCRDVCATHFMANPVASGGPGVTVEKDESLLQTKT